MEAVGVRELKNRLGYYLWAVRQGRAFTVTDRGKPVARLVPVVPPEKGAWSPDLNAVRLAAALTWQERVDYPVVLATFDGELWQAARRAGLEAWPEGMGRG